MTEIILDVNHNRYTVMVEDHWTLLDVLRDKLGFTGAKKGCDHGECGACSVLIDGTAVQSCLVLAVQAQGKAIVTVEGLVCDGRLDPLQIAFHEVGAIQCGFCTPGMIIAAKALLLRNPHPTEDEIKQAMAGNLCRCTGYVKIIEAVRRVAAAGSALGASAAEAFGRVFAAAEAERAAGPATGPISRASASAPAAGPVPAPAESGS